MSQLDKLDTFIEKRKNNWQRLFEGLKHLEEFLILPIKELRSDPSWFGFAITIKQDAPFSRPELINFLDDRKINSRFLFGGNLLWQPAYEYLEHREIGNLSNSNTVALSTFWLGVFPGLSTEMIDYMIQSINEFIESKIK